ncbi:hypothetical protein [Mucilaginibacter antarcticus]
MQDKDFDKLLNQKFADFEVEPSTTTWDNIAAELDGKKAKPSGLPWIRIAAAVLIVATAGMLFLKKDVQITDKNSKLVANRIKPDASIKQETKEIAQAEVIKQAKPTIAITKISASKHQQSKTVSIAKTIISVAVTPADIVDHDPLINSEPILANVSNPASAKTVAILPDVKLTPRILDTDNEESIRQAAVTSAEKQVIEPIKKRGIRNLGGLINAVVARLDKRDDKFIEFSDGDDGDDNATEVTGVNLGLLKIKKQ